MTEARAVVPCVPETSDQSPRVTLTVVVLVGSPLICTRSTLPVAESTNSSTSWFIRNVASANVRLVWPLLVTAAPSEVLTRSVFMGVHLEIHSLDRYVRQSGHEGVPVGEPVADRHGDVIAGFHARLLGSEEPLEKVGHGNGRQSAIGSRQ